MRNLRRIIILILASMVTVMAYSDNPPDRKTGAPGEGLCTDCHSSYPANSGNGSLTISGMPVSYTPSATYSLNLNLGDPGQQRWGFELAVKDSNNVQAGALTVTDPTNTQSSISSGIVYLKQTDAGTYDGTADGPVTWGFNWTAPASGTGPVYFYVAGTACNGSGISGDYVYNIAQQVPEKATSVGDGDFEQQGLVKPHRFELQQNYPNPLNPMTRISFNLPEAAYVSLEIYNLLGQKVMTLVEGELQAGNHLFQWNGKDSQGQSVSSGVYFYRLNAGDFTDVKKMIMMK